ncbi:hypothetical protein CEXT_683411 [Caerostris extrusa]|uniref:Uncharacterized protein n=1 Tax=Caerostris extrusa TaxID=172846 RepID=A0AAV4Y7V8_CAEEX|nr:hypothetical protein CEXT_683411 [Caerostris extrusa]
MDQTFLGPSRGLSQAMKSCIYADSFPCTTLDRDKSADHIVLQTLWESSLRQNKCSCLQMIGITKSLGQKRLQLMTLLRRCGSSIPKAITL